MFTLKLLEPTLTVTVAFGWTPAALATLVIDGKRPCRGGDGAQVFGRSQRPMVSCEVMDVSTLTL